MNQKILDVLYSLAIEKPPEVRKFRICAGVIYKHKELICVGYPRKKSHPVQKEFGNNEHSVYLHAEIDALLRAKKLVRITKDHSLYVARAKHKSPEDDSFILGMSKPCKGCTDFIHFCGIQKTIYTIG